MAKRKRGHRQLDEPAVDVGLGATLAHLHGRDHVRAASPDGDGDGDGHGDGGWTVVGGGNKRRRKERDAAHVTPHALPRPNSSSPHRSAPRDKDEQPAASLQANQLDNPFATLAKDGHPTDGHLLPVNPFAASRTRLGPSSDTSPRDDPDRERKLQRTYPAIEHSHHARLQSHVKLGDLQSLVLYLLADGSAPQWVSVRSRANIQQVVMLMVPGLELGMFNGDIAMDSPALLHPGGDIHTCSTENAIAHASEEQGDQLKRLHISPDDFYPARLRSDRLPPPLKPLCEMFDHVWPLKTPGEHRNNQFTRVHSPIHTMLTSQIPKTQEEKQMKKNSNHKGPMPQNSKHWENKRTRVSEYIMTLLEQQENEYVSHPAMFHTPETKHAARQEREAAKQSLQDGWVDTVVDYLEDGQVPESTIEQGSLTCGRHVISIDCEMCKAEDDQLVLTRISLVDWNGNVVLDELVKPEVAIKDYLTQWSGITAAMLRDITTTLSDIQKELLKLITPRTILIGHSLNSDLNALKLTHPFLIDTGILYPHPRGPPYKQSLKWLAQKYLKREVQKGASGHDSIEDARTCLDLVKQKCEKGPRWGSGDTNAESIFKRLERSIRPMSSGKRRKGGVIDWGDPKRGHSSQAHLSIGCESDDEVVEAIDRVLTGQAQDREEVTEQIDFLWARLRELELARGWWDDTKTSETTSIHRHVLQRIGLAKEADDPDLELQGNQLADVVAETVKRIRRVYNSLPQCTALIVYSGTGDPREHRRLQAMQQQYRREFATKNWDNLSVKWTDTEVQALSQACQNARNGIGFIGVK